MRPTTTGLLFTIWIGSIPGSGQGRLAPQRVLDAADSVLNPALGLVGFAVGLQFGVAHYLADAFLDGAFDLLRGAHDAIFVHGWILLAG